MNIYCQIVNSPISARLCETEQDAKGCAGCDAETRRCLSCHKTHGITLPKLGLCKHCDDAPPTDSLKGSLSKALEQVVSSIREVADREPSEPKRARALTAVQKKVPEVLPIVSQPEKLFILIQEHAMKHSEGVWLVRKPLRVLMLRAKLLRNEAHIAMNNIVERGLCEASPPWDEARLYSAPPVREYSDKEVPKKKKLGRPKGSANRKPSSERFFSGSIESVNKEPHPPVVDIIHPVQPPEENMPVPSKTTEAHKPSKAPGKTFADIYAQLLEKAVVINGERLVRGAVPLLQMEFCVGAPDAVKALEKLIQNDAVLQRNGWGTIVLLTEQVSDNEPAFPECENTRRVRNASKSVRTRAPHLRVVSDETLQESSSSIDKTVLTGALDEAITEIERKLPELRVLRDKVAANVAMLEVSLASLRACRNQYQEANEIVLESLRESEAATTQLLALLRKNSSS